MTILLLFAAALLEAGGDALIRSGLHSSTIIARTSFFLVGAIVLFSYGYVVNAPPWDFGSLSADGCCLVRRRVHTYWWIHHFIQLQKLMRVRGAA